MEVKPFVSVLMTSYNREKFIAEAILSVLNSSYVHFELIIVDDCSTDGTLAIARDFANRDSRIRIYQNEKNLGDYNNRNKAVTYVKGKYFKFVDSDDLIYPLSLGIFVSAMEQFPNAAVGIMSTINQEDKPYPFQMSPSEAYHYHFYIRGLFDTGPSALIFRTDRFREVGGFSGKRYIGDTEINLKLAARWPIVKLQSSLVYWRQHEGQEIVSGVNSTGYLELQLPLLEEEFAKAECPLTKKEQASILKYYKKISAREIVKIALLKKNPGKAVEIFKKLELGWNDLFNVVLLRNKKY